MSFMNNELNKTYIEPGIHALIPVVGNGGILYEIIPIAGSPEILDKRANTPLESIHKLMPKTQYILIKKENGNTRLFEYLPSEQGFEQVTGSFMKRRILKTLGLS